MSLIQSQPWEVRLLLAAQEAFDSHAHMERIHADNPALAAAYRQCEAITRHHSKTFYLASSLLPRDKRLAARALYAFCRITDDLVDTPGKSESERLAALQTWQAQIMGDGQTGDHPVCLAWADTQTRFRVPHGYALQLIEGVARDLHQTRYQTFDELADYAYGVASTVGLMAMHIVGFRGEAALPYAIRLGVALQLTNILRDVGEDWRNGRLYLPLDEMRAFGLTEANFRTACSYSSWRKFMAFQIDRTRRLYDESERGIALLDPQGRFAIAAAVDLYKAILTDIEAHDYDVFTRRASISTGGKIALLPGIWWRSRRTV
jgi:phytoene synthase